LNLRILRLSALVTPTSLETRLRRGPLLPDAPQRRWVQATIMQIRSRCIGEISIHTAAYVNNPDPNDPSRHWRPLSRGFDLSGWSFIDEMIVGPYLDRLRKLSFYVYFRQRSERILTWDWTAKSEPQKTFLKLHARGILAIRVTNSLTWHILDMQRER